MMVISVTRSAQATGACAAILFSFWFQAVPSRAADAGEDAAAPATPAAPHPSRFGRVAQQLGEWNVIVGGGAMIEPEYEGSDEFKISPVPFVSATFNDWLKIDPTGVEATVYQYEALTFSAIAGYSGGRSEDDSDALKGLGDIDAGAVVGGRAALEFGAAEFFVEAEKTIGGDEGFTGKAGVEIEHALSQRLMVSAAASATFADEKHMQAYFGVDATQSANSGYAQYDPGAGVKRVDVSVAVTTAVTENWFVRGEAGVGLLLGDAADSPLVKEEIQPSGMLLIGYRF